MKVVFKIFALAFAFNFTSVAHAQSPAPEAVPEKFVQVSRNDFTAGEKAVNFGIVYGAQWAVYLVTQHETIEDNGSFDNWIHKPWQLTVDKDTYDYNIFKHALAGSLYYQFYRSRGYTEPASFLWAVTSSAAFEFTIETVTEPPSVQDLYLTPVLGSLLGMGFERLSLYFHSMKTWPGRVLGYVFNPFGLLPGAQYQFVAMPVVDSHKAGIQVVWSFQ